MKGDTISQAEVVNQVKVRLFILIEFPCNNKLHPKIPNTLLGHGPQQKVESLVLPDEPEEEDEPVGRAQLETYYGLST